MTAVLAMIPAVVQWFAGCKTCRIILLIVGAVIAFFLWTAHVKHQAAADARAQAEAEYQDRTRQEVARVEGELERVQREKAATETALADQRNHNATIKRKVYAPHPGDGAPCLDRDSVLELKQLR